MTGHKLVGRRDALKILAASAGAVLGAAALPGEWMKPVVETGVLPVHAQASVSIVLSPADELYGVSRAGTNPPTHGVGISFSYADTLGEFGNGWTLFYQINGFPIRSYVIGSNPDAAEALSGDGTNGTYVSPWMLDADCVGDGNTTTLRYYVINPAVTRGSNTVELVVEHHHTLAEAVSADVQPWQGK